MSQYSETIRTAITRHHDGIRWVATNREETASCEAGTPGCCIAHQASGPDAECDTW